MFTYCFNNEFISIFFISLLCILYFYDDERCKMNFPVRDNKVLLYCILYCIVHTEGRTGKAPAHLSTIGRAVICNALTTLNVFCHNDIVTDLISMSHEMLSQILSYS